MTLLKHRLIIITDADSCLRDLAEQVRLALDGGPFALLLRDKRLPWSERARLAGELEPELAARGGELVVSDPAGPVRAAHLSTTAPVPEPRPAVVGRSVHRGQSIDEGLDYITYSPVWPTASKPGYGPAVGVDGLARMAAASPVPVYALGGVTGPGRAGEARRAGAYGVAVMGAVMAAADPAEVVADLLGALESVRGHDA